MPMYGIGSKVKIKEFAFQNPSGGTGMSNWQFNPPYTGQPVVKITKKWFDYETGYRFWGEAVDPALKEYLKANAKDGRVFFSEWDIV